MEERMRWVEINSLQMAESRVWTVCILRWALDVCPGCNADSTSRHLHETEEAVEQVKEQEKWGIHQHIPRIIPLIQQTHFPGGIYYDMAKAMDNVQKSSAPNSREDTEGTSQESSQGEHHRNHHYQERQPQHENRM